MILVSMIHTKSTREDMRTELCLSLWRLFHLTRDASQSSKTRKDQKIILN